MARDVRLIRSPVSVAGMVLTTISAALFVVVFLADLFGLHSNPYIGLVFFVLLPGVFVIGLLLIPLGAWLERRRRRAGKAPSELRWPQWDLNDPDQRRVAVAIFALTIVNVVIVSLGAYRGVEYMDSVQFCSSACHGVMKPEGTAHQNGPHARVPCVQRHVGGGATSFARAKLSGTRQLIALARGSYPRPIGAPVRNMVPARDTCEQCHWPEQLHGDRVRRVVDYGDDEKNTESVTTLQLHVGGGSERLGIASGIHWHMNLANEIEYIATDRERQVIPYVRLKDRSGKIREYVTDGVTAAQLAKGERRRMDCMDCHNRPAHTMASTVERSVNAAMSRGEIPTALPFVHREAVRALKASYPTQTAASDAIREALNQFYLRGYPSLYASHRQDVERAVSGTQRIYEGNVFPEMRVGFGTYPNNIGHIDSAGCFRCHDDNHKAADGDQDRPGLRVLPQDRIGDHGFREEFPSTRAIPRRLLPIIRRCTRNHWAFAERRRGTDFAVVAVMIKNLALSLLVLGATAAASSAQTEKAPGRYDPQAERTYGGVVTTVISVASADGTVGVHLNLKTATGSVVKVHLGPAMFIGMNNFSFLADDLILVTGADVSHGGEEAVWARQVSKNGQTLVLRNPDGTPRWPFATADDPDGCGVSHDPVR